MGSDEIEIPYSKKISTAKGIVYILLFLFLIIIPLVLVGNDLKDKEISIDNIKTSINENIIHIDLTSKIKTFYNIAPTTTTPPTTPSTGGSNERPPIIVNPDEIPPKTCADIYGNPDNPVIFNCNSAEEYSNYNLRSNYGSIICLNSGCTELDCCSYSNDSCSLYSPRYLTSYAIQQRDPDEYSRLLSGIYKPMSGSTNHDDELLRSNNIVNNFNLSGIIPDEYIEYCRDNMYDSSDEGNCAAARIINIDTPAIVNCSEGRKNSDEYTSELRSLYQDSGLIDDYERQAVITCYEGGLDFGNGGCNMPDDGYYIIQQHERSGTNAIALKECSCPDGRPTSGSECPRAHSEFCGSCNQGDPVVIGEGVSQIATCRPWRHSQPCNISDLVEPNNGSIDSSVTQIEPGNSVNIVCNEGYHLEGNAPVCQGGAPTGNFDYTQPICNLNVCTQPDPQTGYVFDDDSDTPCSNLQYGTENCNITCFDTSSGSPSFSCEGNGDPITLSGCPNVCDASRVRHIDRIQTTVDADLYGGHLYHEFTDDEKEFRGNCGNIGDYLLEGQECNIICPENKMLISAAPVCGADGTLSSEMIHCRDVRCRITDIIQPSEGNNATLVSQLSEADAGDYDCTQPTREEGEVLYYTKSELETSLCIDSKCLDGSNYNPVRGTHAPPDWSDEDGDGLSDWLEGWSWPCSQSSTCRNRDQDELADYQDKYSDQFWCTGNEETDATKLDTANRHGITNIPRPCSNINDDWENRRDPNISTISWFYNHYDISMDDSVDDDSNIIKGSISPPPPPTLGNSCMIKCNEGYQYVEDTLQTCSEDGQEISGAEGRCVRI